MNTEDTRTTGLGVVVQKLRAQEEENQRLRDESAEGCLRELRKMLPLGALEIRASITESGTTHIVVYTAYLPFVPYAPTLSEAMAQVRAWKQEQEKSNA